MATAIFPPTAPATTSPAGSESATTGTSSYSPEYHFRPYVFTDPREARQPNGYAQVSFINTVRDVVVGAQSLVQLLHWDEQTEWMARGSDTPEKEQQPVLNNFHRAALSRMLAVSLEMLTDDIERHVELLTARGESNG